MLSHNSILSVVELILYLLITPFAGYLAYKHGRHSSLGYYYLILACVLRIVADIIQLANGNDGYTLASTTVGSIGLSPLLLALAGFLHEHHKYLTVAAHKQVSKWLRHVQVHIHTVCIVGLVLVVVGGVHLATATTAAEVSSAERLREAGAVILLLLGLGLAQYSGWMVYRSHQLLRSFTGQKPPVLGMAIGNMCAAFWIGVRVVYVVVYSFDHNDATINPNTGSLGVKVVLVVGTSLLAVLSLTVGGWVGRDLRKSVLQVGRVGDGPNGTHYELIGRAPSHESSR